MESICGIKCLRASSRPRQDHNCTERVAQQVSVASARVGVQHRHWLHRRPKREL